jgi:hypothetical protein
MKPCEAASHRRLCFVCTLLHSTRTTRNAFPRIPQPKQTQAPRKIRDPLLTKNPRLGHTKFAAPGDFQRLGGRPALVRPLKLCMRRSFTAITELLPMNPWSGTAIRGLTFTPEWRNWAGLRWSKHHLIRLKTFSTTPESRFRDQGVGGSNPPSPTILSFLPFQRLCRTAFCK